MTLPRARINAPQIPVGDDGLFMPTAQRPVRVRSRTIPVDSHFEPHHHAWAQLACCVTGVLQLTVAQKAPSDSAKADAPNLSPIQTTYIVPPSRAVWIPPGDFHSINVLETAEFRTLYIHSSVVPAGWRSSRVIVVSGLIRELIQALDAPNDLHRAGNRDITATRERERLLTTLLLDEIAHATTQALGVPMPSPHHGDKRLRALCDAVLRAPGERSTLAEWAADIGASERTLARLFRTELQTSYQHWRQQAVLAHALPLLARGTTVSQVAAATGYASDSAFSAMFKGAMGQPPSIFMKTNGQWPT